jgi:hypothetical protein
MGASTASTVQGANQAASTASGVGGAAAQAAGMASASLLGPVGIGLAVVGSTISFIQASKEMQLQRQAEADARKAFEEAKKQININPFDALAINKEPYELERQALLAQGAQAIAAGQEGDRGAAATAGRIQMAQNEAQAGQRTAMGADMLNLEKMSAEEDTNIKTQLAGLSLNEAAGYQSQAKEAKDARARAIQQGYQSGAKALEYGVKEIPLYLQGRGNDTSLQQANMAKIGQPTVTPPSQKLVAGALTPLQQSRNVNAPASPVSIFDQNSYLNNSGDFNYFNPYNY